MGITHIVVAHVTYLLISSTVSVIICAINCDQFILILRLMYLMNLEENQGFLVQFLWFWPWTFSYVTLKWQFNQQFWILGLSYVICILHTSASLPPTFLWLTDPLTLGEFQNNIYQTHDLLTLVAASGQGQYLLTCLGCLLECWPFLKYVQNLYWSFEFQ